MTALLPAGNLPDNRCGPLSRTPSPGENARQAPEIRDTGRKEPWEENHVKPAERRSQKGRRGRLSPLIFNQEENPS